MNKKKIAQFSDTPRDKLSEETKKRAAYYGILPDSIQSVDDEFENSIVIGVSDKNNIKGITIGKETLNQWTNQISQSTDPRAQHNPGIETTDRQWTLHTNTG
ncbi:MAG: hypothetical protein U9P81_04430 [Euryarchaeota archaeon]|nr:hypothetical protein [Euryarchaeota archaeon]